MDYRVQNSELLFSAGVVYGSERKHVSSYCVLAINYVRPSVCRTGDTRLEAVQYIEIRYVPHDGAMWPNFSLQISGSAQTRE